MDASVIRDDLSANEALDTSVRRLQDLGAQV